MSVIFENINKFASLTPTKTAVIDSEGVKVSYKQLVNLTKIRASRLSNVVTPNFSRIALCLNESVDTLVTILALNILDATIIPLNPKLKSNQLQRFLKSVDAEVLIVESLTDSSFKDMINRLKVIDLEMLQDDNKVQNDSYSLRITNPQEYSQFLITLSSGSTGDPKPIVFSENDKLKRSKQSVELYNVTHNDVILCASPFFHSLGQRLTFLPLLVGGTLVQLPVFGVQKWTDAVIKYQVTMTIPVSSHLHLLADQLLKFPDKFKSLRCLVSSSASIDQSVKSSLFELPYCDFHEMYGASEIATATSLNKDEAKIKPNSVGFPCHGVEVRVVDENFIDCGPTKIGRIFVKSYLVSSGYYNLPNTTEKSFVNGYFLTGDLGYLDIDGFLYFVDREKDVIIVGGVNIYPSDIEDVISRHNMVEASVVVGAHDLYFGELPVAVIACNPDDKVSIENELRATLRKELSSKQQPIMFFFQEKMPFTPSGKVDRKLIRDQIDSLGLDLSRRLRNTQHMT
jgi:acyl-CoA synthetase (AMP-forming)/AMP-acid ligase II